MSNCIIRFGGNSLLKKSVLNSFISLLADFEKNSVIVVSAIPALEQIIDKGIDNLLQGSAKSETILSEVHQIVSEAFEINSRPAFDIDLSNDLDKLSTLLKGIEFTGDCSLALKDQVISYAERITSRILQNCLNRANIAAVIVLPEEIGLMVTNEYGNATVLCESSIGLKNNIPKGICLIPGSFGINPEGKITRLGKRSADYTAAAMARLTEANRLELWELDKQFRTADLEQLDSVEIIPSLTYSEASELSYFSEHSIHPRIVEPLIDLHIPIHVFSLNHGKKELKTTINSASFVSPSVVKSVVHTDEIAILKLNGPGVGFKPGILAKVTTAFHLAGINIRSVITSQISINIILNKIDAVQAQKLCKQLPLSSVSEIEIHDHVSLIAIVGHGMQQHHGVSAKLFTAVSKHKINVFLSGSGASDLVSYLIVNQSDTIKAITEIHQVFFGKKDRSVV
jgi:aspartate kinase